MFSLLAIGDPHFKSDNGEETQELTEKIVNLINDKLDTINAIAILGDILHKHEKIDLFPFYRAITFLQKIHETIKDYDIHLYIIIGNHDRNNNSNYMTDEHAFNPLKKWKNTFVIDKATILFPKKDFKVLLMPYVQPGRFKEAYESVISESELESTVSLVIAHQEFQGAKMSLIVSTEGDPWNSDKPLCISGHIHDYQMVSRNMIYVGTPIQHGFSDTTKKTVSMFTFDESGYSEERIPLKIKGKTTVKGNVRDFNIMYFPIDDFYVKAKLTGTKQEIKIFKSSKKYEESCKKGIVFQFLETACVELKEDSVLKINTGKSFSERLYEVINTLDAKSISEFKKLFS